MKKFLLLFLSIFLLNACSKDDDPISRRYPCRFFFYVQQHPNSIIFSAYRSSGMFVYVYSKVEMEKGISYRYVYAQSNGANSEIERNRIETQIESNVPYMLGANNEIGLIIGCTNFNGPVAYDRICPNCSMLQPLRWHANRQQVQCPVCQRVYELETGAISSGSDGDALLRYNISLDGTRLSVGN